MYPRQGAPKKSASSSWFGAISNARKWLNGDDNDDQRPLRQQQQQRTAPSLGGLDAMRLMQAAQSTPANPGEDKTERAIAVLSAMGMKMDPATVQRMKEIRAAQESAVPTSGAAQSSQSSVPSQARRTAVSPTAPKRTTSSTARARAKAAASSSSSSSQAPTKANKTKSSLAAMENSDANQQQQGDPNDMNAEESHSPSDLEPVVPEALPIDEEEEYDDGNRSDSELIALTSPGKGHSPSARHLISKVHEEEATGEEYHEGDDDNIVENDADQLSQEEPKLVLPLLATNYKQTAARINATRRAPFRKVNELYHDDDQSEVYHPHDDESVATTVSHATANDTTQASYLDEPSRPNRRATTASAMNRGKAPRSREPSNDSTVHSNVGYLDASMANGQSPSFYANQHAAGGNGHSAHHQQHPPHQKQPSKGSSCCCCFSWRFILFTTLALVGFFIIASMVCWFLALFGMNWCPSYRQYATQAPTVIILPNGERVGGNSMMDRSYENAVQYPSASPPSLSRWRWYSYFYPPHWFGSDGVSVQSSAAGESSPSSGGAAYHQQGTNAYAAPLSNAGCQCPAPPVCPTTSLTARNIPVSQFFSSLVQAYKQMEIGPFQVQSSRAQSACFRLLTETESYMRMGYLRHVLLNYDTCSFNTFEEFEAKVAQNLAPFDAVLSHEFAMHVAQEAE